MSCESDSELSREQRLTIKREQQRKKNLLSKWRQRYQLDLSIDDYEPFGAIQPYLKYYEKFRDLGLIKDRPPEMFSGLAKDYYNKNADILLELRKILNSEYYLKLKPLCGEGPKFGSNIAVLSFK